jgi:2-(1,2-epoxy-1,2-dihydrophenyl)acetyl-CoA isomerase
MTEESVLYDERDGVAHITLNRPHRSNSFDLATAHLFRELVQRAASEQVKAVVVSGKGKRFCAGGDLSSMLEGGLSPHKLTELASAVDAGFIELAELSKPVVAAVHGAVAGAGLGLLLSCDLAIAARSTKLLMAYDSVGLTPDCGVSYLLPRAIGQHRALQLALTGQVLSAAEAKAWGLLVECVDDDAVLARGTELAAGLAQRPTFALGQAKRLIRSSWQTSRSDSGQDEARTIGAAAATPEAAALIATFISPAAQS